MVEKLDKKSIENELRHLQGWTLSPDKEEITKNFVFKNFSEAFAFMTQIALHAEKVNHHPEWANVYNKLLIKLTTHDCDGVSHRDIEFAKTVDSIFGDYK
jgi:4a-hydroxytetrahydrobiopterin dehydratase